jgi:hypothetical protein
MFLLKSKVRTFNMVKKNDYTTKEPFLQSVIQVEYEDSYGLKVLSIKVDKDNTELHKIYEALAQKSSETYIPIFISNFNGTLYYSTNEKPLFLTQA